MSATESRRHYDSLDQSGFVHIACFGKFFFISVWPCIVAARTMALGSIALVPFPDFAFLWQRVARAPLGFTQARHAPPIYTLRAGVL
jgi:hypothetical protein